MTDATPPRAILAEAGGDLEADLREVESEVYDRATNMGRLRGEFAFNQSKLRESFYPKVLPLFTALHVGTFHQQHLAEEISWLEEKVTAMERYQGGFFELRDMAEAKRKRMDRLKPAFEEAVSTLENVSKGELAVLRAYENPPPIVLDTVLTVMTMRGEEVVTWDDAKVMLSETYYFSFFINKCRLHTKASAPPTPEQVEALEKYCLNPEAASDNVLRASVPAGGMAQWLHALEKYYHMERVTQPKEASLEEVRKDLLAKRMRLEERKEDVRVSDAKLRAINDEVRALVMELRDRYDATMDPLQESFFDAHHRFNEVFCSPRRRAASPGSSPR